ncbi:hypothetical protein [Reichenbachiella sp.]|uniref:hypothetical protein n=1 Tax=Reichenbachiella sp. TaxID=2184521 RepID=UPI003B58F2B2
MFREKLIPAILALLVIGAMTLSDYGHIVFESEKIAERLKIENEELEEDSEIKHWIKLLSSGDPSPISNEKHHCICYLLANNKFNLSGTTPYVQTAKTARYIRFCALRIHLS